MSESETEKTVLDCLRRTALAGSDREVSLDEPLTEGGLGLDSMALVGFFVELEQCSEVAIFETEWFQRGDFTLGSLIGHLESSRRTG